MTIICLIVQRKLMNTKYQVSTIVKIYLFIHVTLECNNLIPGCNRCETDIIATENFVVCKECTEGLYLLRNLTYTSSYPIPFTSTYPTYYSSCVSDCKKAHGSFVNDFVTGTCQCNRYIIINKFRVWRILCKLQLKKWLRMVSRRCC